VDQVAVEVVELEAAQAGPERVGPRAAALSESGTALRTRRFTGDI
jgi:hypothetical protein